MCAEARKLDLVTGWGREVTQYPTDCLVSLHKLQQEDDVIIIDEGYNISNSWSINASSVAGEDRRWVSEAVKSFQIIFYSIQ